MTPRTPVLFTFGLISLTVALSGCDDSSSSGGSSSLRVSYEGKTTPVALDETTVVGAADLVISQFPGCGDGTGASVLGLSRRALGTARGLAWFSPYGLRGSTPGDLPGECGGTRTFTDYSHESGVTRGTLSLVDYCTLGQAGEEVVTNADVPFVDNGEPSDMGPVRQSLTADCPESQARSSDGKNVIGGFRNLRFSPATAGVQGSDDEPDTITVAEVVSQDQNSDITTRARGLTFTAGDTETTVEGELCTSEEGCVDVTTDEPIVYDEVTASFTGGTVVLNGDEDTTATLEVIPNATLGFEVTEVNGEPVEDGPIQVVCRLP